MSIVTAVSGMLDTVGNTVFNAVFGNPVDAAEKADFDQEQQNLAYARSELALITPADPYWPVWKQAEKAALNGMAAAAARMSGAAQMAIANSQGVADTAKAVQAKAGAIAASASATLGGVGRLTGALVLVAAVIYATRSK